MWVQSMIGLSDWPFGRGHFAVFMRLSEGFWGRQSTIVNLNVRIEMLRFECFECQDSVNLGVDAIESMFVLMQGSS